MKKRNKSKIKTIKPLIYTAVTNDEQSLACATLLYKSLKKFLTNSYYDFKVIVPENIDYPYPKDLKPYIFPIYNYHYKNISIYTLRYDQKIFNQSYDYFIYMDSDILWTINSLFDMKYNCLCFEPNSMSSNDFSRSWPKYNRKQLKNIPGINSGFFGLNKETALNLSEFMIRNLLTKKKLRRPMFEQNMFNYFIYHNYLLTTKEKENWIDISSNFILGATPDSIYSPQKAYHFFGDIGNMNSKLFRMSKFLSNNSIIL